jgi:hypothetical protein
MSSYAKLDLPSTNSINTINTSSDDYNFTNLFIVIVVIVFILYLWNTYSNHISYSSLYYVQSENSDTFDIMAPVLDKTNSVFDNMNDDDKPYISNNIIKNSEDMNNNDSNCGNNNCNLGLTEDQISNFTKNYGNVYSHQITCPQKCFINDEGVNICNSNNCTNNHNNSNIPALNYYTVSNNNSLDCVSCTKNPVPDCLRQQYTNNDFLKFQKVLPGSEFSGIIPSGIEDYTTPEFTLADEARVEAKKNINKNMNNFAEFNSKINQNSIGETPVDKMAEIRTCETGTCGLKSYGKSIAKVYDELLTNPSFNYQKSCNPASITGVYEDPIKNYAKI